MAARDIQPDLTSSEAEDYEKRIKELDSIIETFIGRAELYSPDQQSKDDFVKKRNAYYSQRKYYRKKLKILKLEKQRDGFLEKNANVRSQNKLLERILESANKQVKLYQSGLGSNGGQRGADPLTPGPAQELTAPGTSNSDLRRLLGMDVISPPLMRANLMCEASLEANIKRYQAVQRALVAAQLELRAHDALAVNRLQVHRALSLSGDTASIYGALSQAEQTFGQRGFFM